MSLYTRSGLTVNAANVEGRIRKGYYVIPEVDALLMYLKEDLTLDLDHAVNATLKATRFWVETGGLFNKTIYGNAKLTQNAKSFILETADLLNGKISKRRVSWADWRLLLCPSESVVLHSVDWTPEQLAGLQVLQSTPTPVLIQRWVSEHGVGDLVQTLGVYVSPSI